MNQFANIGSMFPGAQNKNLRDNAKLALTLPGQPEIIGLVVKNALGDVTIIEQDKVQVFHRAQVEVIDESRDMMVLAGYLYEEYCKAVGGKAYDGKPLPNWQEFSGDNTKVNQLHGWLSVAERAARILKGGK